MKWKIGSIVIACYEFDKMVGILAGSSLLDSLESLRKTAEVVLRDPDRKMPNVSSERSPTKETLEGEVDYILISTLTTERQR